MQTEQQSPEKSWILQRAAEETARAQVGLEMQRAEVRARLDADLARPGEATALTFVRKLQAAGVPHEAALVALEPWQGLTPGARAAVADHAYNDGSRDALAERLHTSAGDIPRHLAEPLAVSRDLAAHGAPFMAAEAYLQRNRDISETERAAIVAAVYHVRPGVRGDAHLPMVDVDDLFGGSPAVVEQVRAVADATCSSPDLMALGALAAASAALARKVQIRLPDGFRTTANLHVVVEASSGRGKGPMTKRMGLLGVLQRWQNETLVPRHERECRLRQIDRDLLAGDIAEKKKDLTKAHRARTDPATEHRLKRELADLETQLAGMPEPRPPWFLINDVTPQRFVDMCQAAGFGALCHGEGQVLLKAFTGRSDSTDGLGALLSSWSVEHQHRDRVGNAGNSRVQDGLVAASVLLPLQPGNLAPVTPEAQAMLRALDERGAFARWIVARPRVVDVDADEDGEVPDPKIQVRYDELLVSLAESAVDLDPERPLAPARPAPVVFDPDTGAAALKFQTHYKAKANPGGVMSEPGPAAVALKLGEQAFRVAAVVAALRVGTFGAEGYRITMDDWQRAVRFVERYVLPNVLACLDRAANTSVGTDAQTIAATLAERGPMTKSALRRGPFKTWDCDKSNDRKSRFVAAFDTAVERGIVRAEERSKPAGPGKEGKIMCYAVYGGPA